MKFLYPAVIWLVLTFSANAEVLRLAVTTSFANSGLADVLLPQIADDTGISVQLLVVGSGQALRIAEAGDVDAVLVHDPAAEERFVAAGHGLHRREIMYNDFVLIGPESDPANTANATTITGALKAIARQNRPFVSRGDSSGTHMRELQLWEAASLVPEGEWYRVVGQGMGAALNTATAMQAYILSDRASWLNFGNRSGLRITFSGDPSLFNQYSFIPVSPEDKPHIRDDLAAILEGWLTSKAAENLINGHTIDDVKLFAFNAVQAQ